MLVYRYISGKCVRCTRLCDKWMSVHAQKWLYCKWYSNSQINKDIKYLSWNFIRTLEMLSMDTNKMTECHGFRVFATHFGTYLIIFSCSESIVSPQKRSRRTQKNQMKWKHLLFRHFLMWFQFSFHALTLIEREKNIPIERLPHPLKAYDSDTKHKPINKIDFLSHNSLYEIRLNVVFMHMQCCIMSRWDWWRKTSAVRFILSDGHQKHHNKSAEGGTETGGTFTK